MDPSALGKRNAIAQNRLRLAVAELAQRFKLDPALEQSLSGIQGDPAVRAMKEREAMAGILEALLASTEKKARKPVSEDLPAGQEAA